MAITYTYEIHELKETPALAGLEKVITEVVYTYKGINEEGIQSPYPGRTVLPEPSPESFKPTAELSKEDVIGWLEAHANLEVMQQAIEKHIEQQSGIILRGSTLPWAPASEEETNTVAPTTEA